jgi:hypothetical protein
MITPGILMLSYNGTFGSGLGHLFQPDANQNERSANAA